ncbi:MAG: hypothetical protein LIR50_11635 [Bacillota bacterium]|nr:hypothetical protein [Bacillota bacterium]
MHGYDNPWPAGGGKNLLPFEPISTTISTVSLIIDDFGIATINGTAGSSLITFGYNSNALMSQIAPGNYYFTAGLAVTGSSSTWDAGVWDSTTNQYAKKWNGTAGSVSYGTTYVECKIEEGHSYTVLLHLRANANAQNLVFKPMLVRSGETNTTWAPYANICPISGWSGMNLARTGQNIWDEQWEDGYIDSSGVLTPYAYAIRSKNYNICIPGASYYYFKPQGMTGFSVCWYDENKTFISRVADNVYPTAPTNARFFKLSLYNYKSFYATYSNDVGLNYPASELNYYPGHIINLNITLLSAAGTVYGGYIHVGTGGTAQLVVTHAYKVFTGDASEGWTAHPSIASWFYIDGALDDPYINATLSGFALCNTYV